MKKMKLSVVALVSLVSFFAIGGENNIYTKLQVESSSIKQAMVSLNAECDKIAEKNNFLEGTIDVLVVDEFAGEVTVKALCKAKSY